MWCGSITNSRSRGGRGKSQNARPIEHGRKHVKLVVAGVGVNFRASTIRGAVKRIGKSGNAGYGQRDRSADWNRAEIAIERDGALGKGSLAEAHSGNQAVIITVDIQVEHE